MRPTFLAKTIDFFPFLYYNNWKCIFSVKGSHTMSELIERELGDSLIYDGAVVKLHKYTVSLPDGKTAFVQQRRLGRENNLVAIPLLFFLGKILVFCFHGQNLVYHGLNALDLPLRAGTE